MRPIDADTVIIILESIEENATDGTENDGTDGTTRIVEPVRTTTREMMDLINDMPTMEAEPRPRSGWILGDPDEGEADLICGHCNKEYDFDVGGGDLVELLKQDYFFCPFCGAKMLGILLHEEA